MGEQVGVVYIPAKPEGMAWVSVDRGGYVHINGGTHYTAPGAASADWTVAHLTMMAEGDSFLSGHWKVEHANGKITFTLVGDKTTFWGVPHKVTVGVNKISKAFEEAKQQ
ncbi:MAG: hypothetical protein ABH814_03550 [bacterium]